MRLPAPSSQRFTASALLLTLALLAPGLGACNRVALDEGSTAESPEASRVRAADRRAAAEVSGLGHAEARGWLQRPGNRLFEGDPARVKQLVDGLYEDGAARVWFTGIEDFGGSRVSGSLVVELPGDPAARDALLRRQALFLDEPAPTRDLGQRYLRFRL